MSTPEEIASALDAAADYIEVHGWCQNAFQDEDGRVCLLGAIARATGHQMFDPLSTRLALRAVSVHLGAGPLRWNDTPGRTEFEVIDELRLTAKALREVAS